MKHTQAALNHTHYTLYTQWKKTAALGVVTITDIPLVKTVLKII